MLSLSNDPEASYRLTSLAPIIGTLLASVPALKTMTAVTSLSPSTAKAVMSCLSHQLTSLAPIIDTLLASVLALKTMTSRTSLSPSTAKAVTIASPID